MPSLFAQPASPSPAPAPGSPTTVIVHPPPIMGREGFGNNFHELITDPRTNLLREASPESKGGNFVGPRQPKNLLQRASDYVTDPYAGTQGKGKEWARDLQRRKESKYTER